MKMISGNLQRSLIFGLAMLLFATFEADAASRILRLKSKVTPKTTVVRMADLVSNPAVLTDAEKDLEVTDAPSARDEVVSLMDIAYMLQRHASLMDANIRGPRKITIQRVVDQNQLANVKNKIIAAIKKHDPWKNWEIDILLSSSDETQIIRAGDFSQVEILPSENRNMLGAVNLNVGFLDEKGHQVGKTALNPTILKKMNVAILNDNYKQGEVLTRAHVRETSMWLGPEAKNYVGNINDCYGKELAKGMSAGDILRNNDILKPLCAKKGDLIQIECRSGALSVKISAVALDGGRAGDSIRAINQTSKKTLNVELIGEKTGVVSKFGS